MAVKNQGPESANTGGYENHVVAPPARDTTSGSNANSAAHTFEGRVVQEIGTH